MGLAFVQIQSDLQSAIEITGKCYVMGRMEGGPLRAVENRFREEGE